MPELLPFALVLVVILVAIAGLSSLFSSVTVFEYQRGVKFREGRLVGTLGPGRHRVYRRTTAIHVLDMRETPLAIPGQEIITSDGISLKLSLAVRYRIADPVRAITEISDARTALHTVVQVALREVAGARSIDEILQKREELGPEVLERSAEKATALGMELVSVDVKDLMFPGPLKRVFAQVIEARQQGVASLEKARGETAALRSLANAARMVDDHPSLLQLRILQQLEASSGHTVVLGLPASSTLIPVRGRVASEPLLDSEAQNAHEGPEDT
jgi:regulator of protease activity HflC (stomatin/prohibitin superfamily)